MVKYIIKRVLISIVVLFFSLFLIYLLMRMMPSSYVEQMARQRAAAAAASGKSYQEWLAQLQTQYGLNTGVFEGFLIWLSHVAGFKVLPASNPSSVYEQTGFGDSWKFTIPVIDKFNEVVWVSFIMSAISFVLEMVIAIPLGILSARKQYSWQDYLITILAIAGISLPSFFSATILKLIFCIDLKWFDLSGLVSSTYMQKNAWGQFWDKAAHLFLPTLNITLLSIGGLMRYTRTNMLEVLNSDYIRTARAKGLSEKKVVNKHAFANTMIPLVTSLGGSLPGLFSGSMITETLFKIPGIGYVSYQAMISGDIPFTMFYMAFLAVLTLLGTLIADILYGVVDPRVRINA